MGKIEYFRIDLKKPNAIYFSGESLVGSLEIKVTERLKINAVKMSINGGAHVRWTETEHNNVHTGHRHGRGHARSRGHYTHSNTRRVTYQAHENYLAFNLIFLSKQSKDDLYLETGNHSYPFSLILPPNLATSFEHQFGKVRYSIVATIDIPWAFDKHSIRSFSVISQLDLNANPGLNHALGGNAIKQFCCGPCRSDPLMADFKIQKGGYVPGEMILFEASFENKSSKTVNDISLMLNQKIQFFANGKIKRCFRTICSLKYSKVIEKNSAEKWKEGLLIPPIPSSSNGTCRLIDIQYALLLSFGSSGLSINTKIEIPVVIGTIPLRATDQMNNFSAPISYQASIFDSNPDEGFEGKGEVIESDEKNFKPFYPYYKDFSNQKY